jgi:hypothetical protein
MATAGSGMKGLGRFQGPRKLLIGWDILGVFRFAKSGARGSDQGTLESIVSIKRQMEAMRPVVTVLL